MPGAAGRLEMRREDRGGCGLRAFCTPASWRWTCRPARGCPRPRWRAPGRGLAPAGARRLLPAVAAGLPDHPPAGRHHGLADLRRGGAAGALHPHRAGDRDGARGLPPARPRRPRRARRADRGAGRGAGRGPPRFHALDDGSTARSGRARRARAIVWDADPRDQGAYGPRPVPHPRLSAAVGAGRAPCRSWRR